MKRKEGEPEGTGTPSFEVMMKRLEDLVNRLDRSDLPLEESIQAFEEGIKLVKQCTAILGDAEKKIQRLTEEGAVSSGPAETAGEERGDEELPF
jgi:exodeoxyribonuclease VII small subunit